MPMNSEGQISRGLDRSAPKVASGYPANECGAQQAQGVISKDGCAKEDEGMRLRRQQRELEAHQLLAQRTIDGSVIIECAFVAATNSLAALIHQWMQHQGLNIGSFGDKIALLHSELSEALEADRIGNPPAQHISGFSAKEEELADVLLRVLNVAMIENLRVAEAAVAKLRHLTTRPYMHGKKY